MTDTEKLTAALLLAAIKQDIAGKLPRRLDGKPRAAWWQKLKAEIAA